MQRDISFAMLVDWAGDNSFSFNETNYLYNASGDESMANPDESTFSSSGYTSQASFTMLNTGRRFSPTASAVVASGGLREHIQNGKFYGKKVRLTVTINGTVFTVFRGFIKKISENSRTIDGVGTVTFSCATEDAAIMNRKLNTPVSDTKSYYDTGKDEGELIVRTLTLAGLSDGTHFVSQTYGGTPTIDRGLFTIPWYWLDSESPIEDCWTLAAACGGRFYYSTADGKYHYDNAQAFAFGEAGTVQTTVDESNAKKVNPAYSDKDLAKKVQVTVRPRRIGESTVLWEPDEVIRILPGSSVTLEAKLDSPVYSFDQLKIIATNTGGFQITNDLSVSSTYYSQSIKFVITNNGIYHAFLRTFQLIGRGIEGGETTTVSFPSLDTTFWASRDGKERSISDNPYIQTTAQAEAICQLLANRQGYFTNGYEVSTYKGTKFLRVGWRVTVSNTTLGINEEVLITKMSWRLSEGNFEQDLTCFSVGNIYHYTPGSYFLIGTNSANQGKRYFY